MTTCPYCQRMEQQVKNGRNGSGSQRYRCNVCNRRYTPEPGENGYPQATCEQTVRLYVDGLNFRRIARTLGVNHQSVINWVNAHAASLPDAPPMAESKPEVVELDDLFTFVGEKSVRRSSSRRQTGRRAALWSGSVRRRTCKPYSTVGQGRAVTSAMSTTPMARWSTTLAGISSSLTRAKRMRSRPTTLSYVTIWPGWRASPAASRAACVRYGGPSSCLSIPGIAANCTAEPFLVIRLMSLISYVLGFRHSPKH